MSQKSQDLQHRLRAAVDYTAQDLRANDRAYEADSLLKAYADTFGPRPVVETPQDLLVLNVLETISFLFPVMLRLSQPEDMEQRQVYNRIMGELLCVLDLSDETRKAFSPKRKAPVEAKHATLHLVSRQGITQVRLPNA